MLLFLLVASHHSRIICRVSKRESTIIKDQFKELALESKKLVIVNFYASWSGRSLHMIPLLEEVAEKNKDKIDFFKVNVDEEPDLVMDLSIVSIPTLIFIKNGSIEFTQTGPISKEDLLSKIKTLLQ
jgi:thioredoxin 1